MTCFISSRHYIKYLIYTSLTVLGTNNLAYWLLISLQLPLHLFTRTLSGWKTGSLLLIFIIGSPTLHHSHTYTLHKLYIHLWLLVATHFKGIAFNVSKLTNANAVISIFLINPNIILYHAFSLNTCECLIYH